MSQRTVRPKGYAARATLPLAGGLLLAMGLIVGISVLTLYLGWPAEGVLLAATVLITAGIVLFAAGLGRCAARDAMIFCQDDEGRMFVVDARRYAGCHRGIAGYVKMAVQTQKVLETLADGETLERRLSERESLQGMEPQILAVENLKENGKSCSLICQVRYPGGKTGRQTYQLIHGYIEEERLLYELGRLRTSERLVESEDNRGFMRILFSVLALFVTAGLCVLSHPAVGELAEAIYFPCLGLAMISLYALIYFIIRQRRGE